MSLLFFSLVLVFWIQYLLFLSHVVLNGLGQVVAFYLKSIYANLTEGKFSLTRWSPSLQLGLNLDWIRMVHTVQTWLQAAPPKKYLFLHSCINAARWKYSLYTNLVEPHRVAPFGSLGGLCCCCCYYCCCCWTGWGGALLGRELLGGGRRGVLGTPDRQWWSLIALDPKSTKNSYFHKSAPQKYLFIVPTICRAKIII